MCLAKAYVVKDDNQELVASEIASLKIEDGKLLLTTLFGESKEVEGVVKEIDFMSSSITVGA